MSHRIKKVFSKKSKKLVTFITGGDPNYTKSLKIIKNLKDYGSDIIEIGMPFSDPTADGPIIHASSLRAIKKGINLNKIFLLCKEFRKTDNETPLILMGYYNPIHHFGVKKFINQCNDSGIDGLIVVDLQPENDSHLSNLATKKNIEFIRLITPTTDEMRLRKILTNASGFLYYVSITGITGAKIKDMKKLKLSVEKLKSKTNLPIMVGFGIKKTEQAKKIAKFADGIVIGSSIVKIIEDHIVDNILIDNTLNKINRFVRSFAKAIK